MATSTAETMTGCGERYNQHCQYDSKSFDHRLEAGTVAAALGSTQTGTGVTNGAARFITITITILKIMLKIVIQDNNARVRVLPHAARSTAVPELSPSQKHWPSKTSSLTGQVNPTGPRRHLRNSIQLISLLFLDSTW